jgi:octopine/nopaline transport system substrate-binding protein
MIRFDVKSLKCKGAAVSALVCAALAFFLIGVKVASARTWTAITIVTEGGYEPWNMTAPDGSIVGFEPEFMRDLCARMNLTCTIVSQDWDGMIAGLNAGKFDVIMDALAITPDRAKVIAFTVPFASTPAAFVAVKADALGKLPGTGSVIELASDPDVLPTALDPLRAALKGQTIGVQVGNALNSFIYKHFQDVAEIREYKTAADRTLDLADGRIDIAFDDMSYLNWMLARPENSDLGYTGPEIRGPIWGIGEGLGLRLSDPDLKAMFDDAITSALADGTVRRLSEKWFKMDISP